MDFLEKQFEILSAQCPRLKYFCRKLIKGKLKDKECQLLLHLLVSTGYIKLARRLIQKFHLQNSDSKLGSTAIFSLEEPFQRVLCTDMGCNKDTINRCHKVQSKRASPKSRIKTDRDQLEKLGLLYDEKGDLIKINSARFARHFLSSYDLKVSVGPHDNRFFLYLDNVWKERGENQVGRILWRLFHLYAPGKCNFYIEKDCLHALSRLGTQVEGSSLRPDEQFINVQNGLLDLKTFQLLPHSKDVITTVQLPVWYDPQAKCPKFKKFLNDIFLGDKELILLVTEILGYCLCTSVKAQHFFLFQGDGRNGKSVLSEILANLAGKDCNVSSVALKDLSQKFSRAEIVNKLLNLSTENTWKKNCDTEIIKAIVAGENIQIERKYENAFTYAPFCKLLFCVNEMPLSADTSYGMARRLIVIPFDKRYELHPKSPQEGKLDPFLAEKLLREQVGIFTLAMKGLKRLIANNFQFTHSQRAEAALNEFLAASNPYIDFIKTYVRQSEADEKVEHHELYRIFCLWAKLYRHVGPSLKTFLGAFRKGLTRQRIQYKNYKSNGIAYFKGLTVDRSSLSRILPRSSLKKARKALKKHGNH